MYIFLTTFFRGLQNYDLLLQSPPKYNKILLKAVAFFWDFERILITTSNVWIVVEKSITNPQNSQKSIFKKNSHYSSNTASKFVVKLWPIFLISGFWKKWEPKNRFLIAIWCRNRPKTTLFDFWTWITSSVDRNSKQWVIATLTEH